jgi:predicted RNA binding protein YcfA (HicA-like mRNA interferase family)
MSPHLKRLTGRDALKAVTSLGFDVVSTRGAHAKLKRILPNGETLILTIPFHRNLDLRTVRAIFWKASRFVPEAELHPWFFND